MSSSTSSYRDPVESSSAYVVYQAIFITLYYALVVAIVRLLYRSYAPGRPLRSTRWQLGVLLGITAAARGTTFFFVPLLVAELLRTIKDIFLVSIFASLIAYWAQICHFVFDRALVVTRYRKQLIAGTTLVSIVRLAQGVVHVVDRSLLIRDILGGIYVVFLVSLFAAGLFFGSSLLQRLRSHASSRPKHSMAYARALRITAFLVGMSVIAFAVFITFTLRYTVFASARCKDDGSNQDSCDPELWFWLKLIEKVGEIVSCFLLFIIIQPSKKSRHARGSTFIPDRAAQHSIMVPSYHSGPAAASLRPSTNHRALDHAESAEYVSSTADSSDDAVATAAQASSTSPLHMTSNPLSTIQEGSVPQTEFLGKADEP